MVRKKKGSGIHWGLKMAIVGFLSMLPFMIGIYYYGAEGIGMDDWGTLMGMMFGVGLMGVLFGISSYTSSFPSSPGKHNGSLIAFTIGIVIIIILILIGYWQISIDARVLYVLSIAAFGAIIFGFVLYGNE